MNRCDMIRAVIITFLSPHCLRHLLYVALSKLRQVCLFSWQTLRERYLPPWQALAGAGMLRGIMASQSAVNHVPMHCHKRLITGVLRRELNASNVFVHSDGTAATTLLPLFPGPALSLWTGGCVIGCIAGTYRMASSQAGAAKLAIGAGVDMDFAGCSYTCKRHDSPAWLHDYRSSGSMIPACSKDCKRSSCGQGSSRRWRLAASQCPTSTERSPTSFS